MDTTVTGIFPNQQQAARVSAWLETLGFRPDQIRVVSARTPDRHEFIDERSSNTRRAVILGAIFGVIGGSLTGVALAGLFGLVKSVLVGGLAAAMGGALLGLGIGRATANQVRDELEHQVDAGTVLVSVTTDETHKLVVLDLLAKEGGTSVVSSAVSYTAGVLSTTPEPASVVTRSASEAM
jgi:predicted lipid-binding transport protein (Tim44 family)